MTKSSPKAWLAGKPEMDILAFGLPINRAILKNFIFHHLKEGLTIILQSVKVTMDAALAIRGSGQRFGFLPSKQTVVKKKLCKMYDTYCVLKWHRLM